MTTVYGVTRYGGKLQIERQLEKIKEFLKNTHSMRRGTLSVKHSIVCTRNSQLPKKYRYNSFIFQKDGCGGLMKCPLFQKNQMS